MLKLIGFCTVVWALFYFGIAQVVAIWTAVALTAVASI